MRYIILYRTAGHAPAPVASVWMERMVVMRTGSGVSVAVTLAAHTGSRVLSLHNTLVRRGSH